MHRHLSFGARSVATLLAMSASGCWLVWGIEPLSEEVGTGGSTSTTLQTTTISTAGGGPGTGGAPQGGGGQGGGGGEGGAPPEVGCSPATGTDGSFKLLSVCHGFAPRRIAAAEDRLVVTGDALPQPDVAFVKVFDLSGNETASLPMPDALKTNVDAYVTLKSDKRIVVGGSYKANAAPTVDGQTPSACTGTRCGFVAVLDYGLNAVWVEWLDPGNPGWVEVAGVDASKSATNQERQYLGIVGNFNGTIAPFGGDEMIAGPAIVPYVVTADVEDAAPAQIHQFQGLNEGRAAEVVLHPLSQGELWATFVGFQGSNAALATILTASEAPWAGYVNESGKYVDVTRAGTGFRLARDTGQQIEALQYAVTAFPPPKTLLAVLAMEGGRVAANAADDTFVAGGFKEDNTVIGGTQLTNAGDGSTRDMVLVKIDADAIVTPYVLEESSPDDATIEDVAVSPTGRTFFVASFRGVLHFGGQTFTALPKGSMVIGELLD